VLMSQVKLRTTRALGLHLLQLEAAALEHKIMIMTSVTGAETWPHARASVRSDRRVGNETRPSGQRELSGRR
jgi:hypothetical protein